MKENNHIVLDHRGGWIPLIDTYKCENCGYELIDSNDSFCPECKIEIKWIGKE